MGALAPEVCANSPRCAQILSGGFIPMVWLVAVFSDGLRFGIDWDVKQYFVKRFGLVALLRAW